MKNVVVLAVAGLVIAGCGANASSTVYGAMPNGEAWYEQRSQEDVFSGSSSYEIWAVNKSDRDLCFSSRRNGSSSWRRTIVYRQTTERLFMASAGEYEDRIDPLNADRSNCPNDLGRR